MALSEYEYRDVKCQELKLMREALENIASLLRELVERS